VAIVVLYLGSFQPQAGFAQATPPPKKAGPTASKVGTLTLDVGLVMKTGDVTRVARTRFVLLKQDAAPLLRDAYGLTEDRNSLEVHCIRTQLTRAAGSAENYDRAVAALRSNTAARVDTSFEGTAKFSSVPVNKYHVFGVYEWSGSCVAWNVPVTIRRGSQTLILDQHNIAAYWR
jgi:hypothetical protein